MCQDPDKQYLTIFLYLQSALYFQKKSAALMHSVNRKVSPRLSWRQQSLFMHTWRTIKLVVMYSASLTLPEQLKTEVHWWQTTSTENVSLLLHPNIFWSVLQCRMGHHDDGTVPFMPRVVAPSFLFVITRPNWNDLFLTLKILMRCE